jgi:hypothetical protein
MDVRVVSDFKGPMGEIEAASCCGCFTPRERAPGAHYIRRLDETQSQSGCFGVEISCTKDVPSVINQLTDSQYCISL